MGQGPLRKHTANIAKLTESQALTEGKLPICTHGVPTQAICPQYINIYAVYSGINLVTSCSLDGLISPFFLAGTGGPLHSGGTVL